MSGSSSQPTQILLAASLGLVFFWPQASFGQCRLVKILQRIDKP